MEQRSVRRRLTGDRNQCPSCGEFFNSTHAFVKHKTGRMATPERRCMSIQEMIDKGMVKNSKDFWVSEASPLFNTEEMYDGTA